MAERLLTDAELALEILKYEPVPSLPRPGLYGLLVLTVRDRDGRVVERRVVKTRSPTQNLLYFLAGYYYSTCQSGCYVSTSYPDSTSASSGSYFGGVANCYYPGSTSFSNLAIIVGSGAQSSPYTACCLQYPLTTSQVTYGPPSVSSTVGASGYEAYVAISETVYNGSSSSLSVSEIGIFAYLTINPNPGSSWTSSNTGWFLVWYDVLSTPVTLGPGQYLSITYVFVANP